METGESLGNLFERRASSGGASIYPDPKGFYRLNMISMMSFTKNSDKEVTELILEAAASF